MQATIAVLEGDAVGPEIMAEGLKVLEAIAEAGGHKVSLLRLPFGAGSYFANGSCFPADTKQACDNADAWWRWYEDAGFNTFVKGWMGSAFREGYVSAETVGLGR